MKQEYMESDSNKAEEIAEANDRYYGENPYVECREYFSIDECYISAMEMAEWKNNQFKDYFYSVLSIKMLHFLNEKEKRENTSIDKMDWHKTMDEFAHYLKQKEN